MRERERQVFRANPTPHPLQRAFMRPGRPACLSTQTPNSTEVCGQDGSELQLQGIASFSSDGAQTHTDTYLCTHLERCFLTHLSFRVRKRQNLCCYFGIQDGFKKMSQKCHKYIHDNLMVLFIPTSLCTVYNVNPMHSALKS